MNINETTVVDHFVAPLADDEVMPRRPMTVPRSATQVSRDEYNDDFAFYHAMALPRKGACVVMV